VLREFDIKKISDIVIKKLTVVDIITPKIFERTFIEVAEELGFDPQQIVDEKVSGDLIENSIIQLEAFDKQTRESFDTLKSTTDSASSAISNKDHDALKKAQKDIAKLEQRLEELENDIHEDSLTGAFNRKWLRDILLKDQEFLEKGSMALVDLNNFKAVNDTHGHLVGDKVLSLVSFLLKNISKKDPSVKIIRYGGDEFFVYSNNSSIFFLESELKAIRSELEKKPVKTQGKSFHISFAFGVAQLDVGVRFEAILEQIDTLMYQDKSVMKKVAP